MKKPAPIFPWTRCVSRAACACACLFLSTAPKLLAQAPPARQGFDAFRMVQTRNIFDPERQPIRPASARPVTPVSRADYASLTGIMATPEKTLAFFSGSRPEFNKVLPVRGQVAGATVTRIAPNEVEIEIDGKKSVLTVGQSLPLGTTGGGPPLPPTNPTANAVPTNAPAAPAPGEERATPATPGAPPISDHDELIKRMMQRRLQETK